MGKVLSTEYKPVTLVLADKKDLEEYFRGLDAELPSCSIQAIIGYVDGKPGGIGGVYAAGGRVEAFFEVKPECRKYKRAIWASIMLFRDEILKKHRFVRAYQDPKEPASQRLMEKLNFYNMGTGEFRWLWG